MNVLVCIWILLIIMGFFVKRSKWLVLIQSLFIAAMFALNNGNPDQWKYINLYSQLKSNPVGIFSGNIGLNVIFYLSSIFNQYNISIFFICVAFLFLMYKGVLFYTKNTSLVFSLYLISPFVIDSIQIKNFFAMIVWLYFSRYLYLSTIKVDVKKNVLMYSIGVLLSSTIHYSFLFTALYVLLAFVNKDNFPKLAISLTGIFVILTFIINNLMTIISKLSLTGISMFNVLYSKIQDYRLNYDVGSADARKYVTVIFYIIIFLVFVFIYLSNGNKNNLIKKESFNFVMGVTALSVMIIPLIDYSQEIYRIQRNLLILYYSIFACAFDNKIIEYGKLKIFRLIFVFINISVAFYYLYIESIHWNFDTGFRILFKI